jgi:hypothetical protein
VRSGIKNSQDVLLIMIHGQPNCTVVTVPLLSTMPTQGLKVRLQLRKGNWRGEQFGRKRRSRRLGIQFLIMVNRQRVDYTTSRHILFDSSWNAATEMG